LGYLIATASRSGSGTKNADGVLTLKADFTQPSSIPSLFTQVHSTFSTYPSVVVWNAASMTAPPVSDSIFSVPEEKFVSDLTVNTVSPYVAAQEAVQAWEKMGEEGGKKVFIYTGNILNQKILPFPLMLTLGVGKSASAHWLGLADATYKAKGYRYVTVFSCLVTC
jgi:NAD(P)-dependent dehydrogenase (short-subunit alcohol dehydrogenase family)